MRLDEFADTNLMALTGVTWACAGWLHDDCRQHELVPALCTCKCHGRALCD